MLGMSASCCTCLKNPEHNIFPAIVELMRSLKSFRSLRCVSDAVNPCQPSAAIWKEDINKAMHHPIRAPPGHARSVIPSPCGLAKNIFEALEGLCRWAAPRICGSPGLSQPRGLVVEPWTKKCGNLSAKLVLIDVESFGDGSMSQYPKHHLNRGMSTHLPAFLGVHQAFNDKSTLAGNSSHEIPSKEA